MNCIFCHEVSDNSKSIEHNSDLIEQGEDKKGKFYKVYYQEEN